MTPKILKVGKSWAVTLPGKTIKDLGLRAGDRVRVGFDTREKTLRLAPPRELRVADRKIAKLAHSFIERYRKDLEALARK